ncbi:MAG: restriction endonuclease subunit S [Prevotella sp.]|nr:restriction endonuclease subunit S [Prevotella sp.]
MKEGWEYKKLGEVCDFISGFAFKSNKFTKSGEPIIRISDIHDGIVDDSNVVFFNKETYNVDLSKYIIKPNDILIAMSGGTTGKIGVNTNNKTYYLNQRVGLFHEKSLLNHYFLYYFLQTKREESLKVASGAAQPNLSTAQIKAFEIPVPSLSEQLRIVSYLDAAFAKIDAVAKNAEDSLNEAKALFQSALAKMMEPKEGWEEVTLDNICSIESTLVDPTDDNYNNLLHVGGANIESYTGRLINLMTAKDERLTSGKYLFDSNVVLYNKVRPYLVKVARPDFNGLCSADMYPLTPKKETTREFLYYLLIKKEFTNYAIKCSARAGMPKINRNSLFAYKASIPLNRKEQIRIVSTLDNIRKVLMHLESNLSRTLTECTALKQAILRQTFE